jgi:ethanolamine kinase
MPPSDYIRTRELGGNGTAGQYFSRVVDNHPYFPNLSVDATDSMSVRHAALVLVYSALLNNRQSKSGDNSSSSDNDGSEAAEQKNKLKSKLNEFFDTAGGTRKSCMDQLSCTKVTGGITNALFRVSGFQTVKNLLVDTTTTTAAATTGATTDNCDYLDFDSVLVRIFGAEGMIDRDIETSTYAALCNANIAYKYMGRFANGRIEGWLDGYHPLQLSDLNNEDVSLEIAKEMARLHCLFEVPEGELREHHCGKSSNSNELDVITVGLWDQLNSWMEQAKGYTEFKTPADTERVRQLKLDQVELEVQHMIEMITNTPSPSSLDNNNNAATSTTEDSGDSTASICGDSTNNNAKIVFCHNDLLPANIMRHPTTGQIQLIDFEYGGSNYAAFDMANHFNEYAGGTTTKDNGVTNYSNFPNQEQQTKFCVEYIKMARRLESMRSDITDPNYNGDDNLDVDQKMEESSEQDNDESIMAEATALLSHVQKFIMVNHLYWGLWAVNQAAEEGCDEFDYLTYAANRLNEYYVKKKEWEEKN